MISTVLCGRFYKIFVSPMLHKKAGFIACFFFVEHLRLRRFHSLKGLRPLKHPRSALRASESLYISQARFEVRFTQPLDYQLDTRSPLIHIYQSRMHKML